MQPNFNRKLSSTNPSGSPHEPSPPEHRPELHEVSAHPAIFDSRYMAWRIWNPNHPLANDKEMLQTGRSPRQQALDSCNILQLFAHVEYYLPRYQLRFAHWNGRSNVLLMPYAIIPPEQGWKLFDRTDGKEYKVKAIGSMKDLDGKPCFDGRVTLYGTTGPAEDHFLEWIDPYGEIDGKCKLIKMLRRDEVRALLEPQAQQGDASDVKSKSWTPVISYEAIRQEPASIDGGMFTKSKELKPRLRMVVRDPEDPSVYQKILGQWTDNLVEFRVHSTTGKVADRLTVWLKNFFMLYTGVLMQLGVQQVLYWGTIRDKEETRTVYDLSVRNVQFYFRLDEIQVELVPVLGHYEIALQTLHDQDPVPWFTSEPEAPEFPTDTSGGPLYGDILVGDDY